jgi:hypothetical protein
MPEVLGEKSVREGNRNSHGMSVPFHLGSPDNGTRVCREACLYDTM